MCTKGKFQILSERQQSDSDEKINCGNYEITTVFLLKEENFRFIFYKNTVCKAAIVSTQCSCENCQNL